MIRCLSFQSTQMVMVLEGIFPSSLNRNYWETLTWSWMLWIMTYISEFIGWGVQDHRTGRFCVFFLTQVAVFSMPSLGRRGEGALWVFFNEGINPICDVPYLWLNHLPKAAPPNTVTLEIRCQHTYFEGDTNIQQ